jgi:hypothetical protein
MASRTSINASKLVCTLSIFLSLGFVSSAHAEDDCQMWTHRGYPVEMGFCSYPDGGSGYTVMTNMGDQSATICWTLVANSGKRMRSCHSYMESGETSKASASSCGTKNGGCSQIILESYKVN